VDCACYVWVPFSFFPLESLMFTAPPSGRDFPSPRPGRDPRNLLPSVCTQPPPPVGKVKR